MNSSSQVIASIVTIPNTLSLLRVATSYTHLLPSGRSISSCRSWRNLPAWSMLFPVIVGVIILYIVSYTLIRSDEKKGLRDCSIENESLICLTDSISEEIDSPLLSHCCTRCCWDLRFYDLVVSLVIQTHLDSVSREEHLGHLP
jgi:hypothetical protein